MGMGTRRRLEKAFTLFETRHLNTHTLEREEA